MSAKSNDAIYKEISTHIDREGSARSFWYVGIAADIAQRLHDDHGVPERDHWFIHRVAHSAEDARTIEKELLAWGCDGGPGGGDQSTRFVYAYLKNSSTDP